MMKLDLPNTLKLAALPNYNSDSQFDCSQRQCQTSLIGLLIPASQGEGLVPSS